MASLVRRISKIGSQIHRNRVRMLAAKGEGWENLGEVGKKSTNFQL